MNLYTFSDALAQVTENGIGLGGIFDKPKIDIDSYKEVIRKFSELNLTLDQFKLEDGSRNWNAIAKAIGCSDKAALSYFQDLEDGNGVIDQQAASVDELGTHLKKAGNSAGFAAAKTALFNIALNAGIMLAVTVAINLLSKALDNASDSLEDVEARIQNNKTALSDYTSKVEELTKRLEELNQTDVKYLSDDEQKELETEAAYISSQLELYKQLADAKQKAINDDYIKATMGVNQETAYKKMWEELSNGKWGDLYSSIEEASESEWYDFIAPLGLSRAFKSVDDGNYFSEADKLLDKYQELQNKYVSLQKIADKKGNNETLDQNLEKTQSQMYQTAANLSQYIEQIQTARDALANSSNKDDYADIIAEMDEAIAKYQKVLTGNVYASEYLGISDLQRDLTGIRDVLKSISDDTGASAIFDPIIEQIDDLISVVKRLSTYSFTEILDLDKAFLADKLSELQERLHNFKVELTDEEFLDKLKTTLSASMPPELVENWERFKNTIKDIREQINGLIQEIDSRTGLSDILGGLEERLDDIRNVLSDIIDKFGWIFKDAIEAWNKTHDLDYSERTKNSTDEDNSSNPPKQKESEILTLSISETIDQLNTRLKPAFDSLKSAYQDIFTDSGFELNSINIISTCNSIKSKLDDMAGLGLEVDYSSYEEFVKVLRNSESTEKEVKDAFDDLATSITNAGLSGAEDFATLKAALEDLGVVNSEMVAFDALISNTKALKEANLDLANATYEDIVQFADEHVAAENLSQAINMLITQQKMLNALEDMDTSTEVANMISLAKQVGVTGDVIENLTELEKIYQEVASGTLSEHMLSKKLDRANELKQLIEAGITKATYTPEVDFSGVSNSAEKTASSAAKSFTDLLDKELNVLDKKMEAGYIDFNDYIKARLDLIEDYYRQGKLAADEYYSYIEKHYKQELSYRDKVIKAVTRRIDKEIDNLEKQKDDIESYYKVQIDALTKEKTLLQDANKERQREIDLQKAMYELERAKNQRTKLIYSEDKGMHYVADDDSIRDAENEVENAEYEFKLSEIESKISKLEQARDRETNAIDDMIDKLKEYKDQWNDITSAYEEEQEDLIAAQMLGRDWEKDILDTRLDKLNEFKDDYIKIQQAMVDAAYQAAQAIEKQEKVTIGDSSGGGNKGGNGGDPEHGYEVVDEKTGTRFKAFATKKEADDVAESMNKSKAASYGMDLPQFENSNIPGYYVKKYHTGLKQGLVDKHNFDEDFKLVQTVGLGEKEVPAILKEGEAVVTPEQISNIADGLSVDSIIEMQKRFADYVEKMGGIEAITGRAMTGYNQQMEKMVNQLNNNTSIVNNKNVQPVINGGINITCPGITSQEVARQVGAELNNMFNGFHNFADQQSRIR